MPTLGVGTVAGDPGFPVLPERRLHFGIDQNVWHNNYFSQLETGEKLKAWLVLPPDRSGLATRLFNGIRSFVVRKPRTTAEVTADE